MSRTVAGLRERVRSTIPFSQDVYEQVIHLRRRKASRKVIERVLSSGAAINLDIGGGYRKGENGWINVDTAQEADLYWDLREGIPFADGTVDAIYSSHLFEHLTFVEGQSLMKECLRALKPGGLFSIVVPNARLYVESYLGLRELPDEFFAWEPAFNGTTAIDAINYVAYMNGEHKYLFDQENLLHRLSLAGFADVSERPFDPAIDRPERDYESIYARGRKPSTP